MIKRYYDPRTRRYHTIRRTTIPVGTPRVGYRRNGAGVKTRIIRVRKYNPYTRRYYYINRRAPVAGTRHNRTTTSTSGFNHRGSTPPGSSTSGNRTTTKVARTSAGTKPEKDPLAPVSRTRATSFDGRQYTYAPDKDGCWRSPSWCMKVVEKKWSKKRDRFIVRYRNVCRHRIYARFCNRYNSGKWSCGADGIRPGRFKRWDTYNANGEHKHSHVGAVRGSYDWVCRGRLK